MGGGAHNHSCQTTSTSSCTDDKESRVQPNSDALISHTRQTRRPADEKPSEGADYYESESTAAARKTFTGAPGSRLSRSLILTYATCAIIAPNCHIPCSWLYTWGVNYYNPVLIGQRILGFVVSAHKANKDLVEHQTVVTLKSFRVP